MRINIPMHHIRSHSFRLHAEAIPVLSLTVKGADGSHLVVELATFKFNEDNCVTRLAELLKEARERAKSASAEFMDQPVVVDFGMPAEVKETAEENDKEAKTKEEVVCNALAIEHGPDVWGELTSQ